MLLRQKKLSYYFGVYEMELIQKIDYEHLVGQGSVLAHKEKSAYRSPMLCTYGAVSRLTQIGKSGPKVDGANINKKSLWGKHQ